MKYKIVLTFFLISHFTFAQETFKFLELDNSPRAASLAGSFVSNIDDPNVIFYNPAGIGYLQNNSISFSHVFHLAGINSSALSYSHEFEEIGKFGAALKYINYGSFVEANAWGVKTGEFGAGELAAIIGYSNKLDENFNYGANIKFIFSSIAGKYSTGLALDLGLHYTIPDTKWNFGFSILNLGTQLTQYYTVEEKLPLDIRLGFSKTLAHLPLTFYVSLNKLNGSYDSFGKRFQNFTFGGEFKVSKVIKLRFGYDNQKRKDYKINGSAGIGGFNLGIGILISNYNFDYAFSSLGSIGSFHRIGLTTNL